MKEEQRRRAKQLFDEPDYFNEHTAKDLVETVNKLIDIQKQTVLLLANLERRVTALEKTTGLRCTEEEVEKETCDKNSYDDVAWVNGRPVCWYFDVPKSNVCPRCKTKNHERCNTEMKPYDGV